jgi:hypothetical protein
VKKSWPTLLLILATAVACGSPRSPATTPASKTASTTATPASNSDGTPKRLPPSPPDLQGALVMSYEDFGPSVAAHELLGDEMYSWGHCGCAEPGDEFDIRVVVYRGRELADVQAAYPTAPNLSDYRYVSYDAAVAYLDKELADLGNPTEQDDPIMHKLAERLHATRADIVKLAAK